MKAVKSKKKPTHGSRFIPCKPGLSNVFGIDLKPKFGLCCDASVLNGNPGDSEYQILDLNTNEIIKSYKIGFATNNLAEFYAIVDSINIAIKKGGYTAVYSDSQIALGWFYSKEIRTSFDTEQNRKIDRINDKCCEILNNLEIKRGSGRWHFIINGKIDLMFWDKHKWGENPADYGRK